MTTVPIVRNADVLFVSTFTDVASIPIQPTTVDLLLTYHVQGALTNKTVSMANQGAGVWKAIWSNGEVDAGTVEWCIIADGANSAADQGFFQLSANRANPQTIVT